MSNILITGATGYLGSKLTEKLLMENHQLLCIVLAGSHFNYLNPYKNQVHCLFTNAPDFEHAIREFNPDVIIHTACRYDRENTHPKEILDANLVFPFKILEIILDIPKVPLWLNTNTSLDKWLNSYTLSKRQFSEWGRYYSNKGNLHFINIILEHFYGAGDSGAKFVPYLLEKMLKHQPVPLTTGKQRRDFIHIDDVTKAFLFLMKQPPTGYSDIPLGTGESPTIREVVAYLKDVTHSQSELQFGTVPLRIQEPVVSVADTSLLQKMGFRCQYSWQDGFKALVDSEVARLRANATHSPE